jgi:hypothetical protein
MRWHIVMMFGCTPAATPSVDVPTEPPQRNWVRRLSDIEVHADRITFIDLESSPQRLAALVRPPDIEAGSFDGGPGASRTISATRAGFRSCYNKGLQTDPTMQGKAIFKVKIGPDGGQPVSVEQTGGSGLSDGVVACIERKIEAVSFDAPGGSGSTLQVPITFVQQANPNVKPSSPDAPAGWIDFDALRACDAAARKKGALTSTNATFKIDDGDGGFDVRVDPFEGDPELLACAADVVSRIERGSAPRPFAFRIVFVP